LDAGVKRDAVAHGGGVAGLGQKRPSGAHFEHGLHREGEGAMASLMEGSGSWCGGWSGITAVRRGFSAPASSCPHDGARERE
jgi:hypothetical protein